MTTDDLDVDDALDGLEPIERLTLKVGKLTTAIRDERQARRFGHRLGALAVVAVLLFCGLLWRNIRDIEQTRTEARVAACVKDKKFATAHDKLVIALATAGGTRPITPDIQPKVDEQLVPVPDCSPAGIAAFYHHGKKK